MKKNYIWHGKQYQFTEGKQPADAVLVGQAKDKAPAAKVPAEPAKNKARETKKK